MRVTTFSDFALRVLMYLALNEGRRATAAEIAGAYGISHHHLTKVVHLLGRGGWIRTTRGQGGGLALEKPPTQIRLGEVVRACEGGGQVAPCHGRPSGDCRIAPVCRLAGIFEQAQAAFYAELDRHTLADLVLDAAPLQRILMPEADSPGASRRCSLQ